VRALPSPWSARLRVASLALGIRVVTALVAFFANIVFPAYQRPQFTVLRRSNAFWDTFARYDSGWLNGIARDGYEYVAGGRSNLAYFPVYPMLMRYVGRLFGRRPEDFFFAGIIVSWVAFVLAMVVLYELARLALTPRRAERAVLLAAIFPFGFFFGVVYTESVFLLFTLLSFYGFQTRRWMLGGGAGALATATRVNGVLMVPALAWVAWHSAGPEPRDRVRAAGALALTVCGIGAYSLYVYSLSGNPIEWAASIQRWGYHPGGSPLEGPLRLIQALATRPYAFLAGEHAAPYDVLNGVTALIFVAAVPFVWSRFGAGYGLFMLANLWLPLSSGQYEGLGRYFSVMFPCFIWVASLQSRVARDAALVVSAMFYTLCLALFTTIHPLF
jgi:hypothetical protein